MAQFAKEDAAAGLNEDEFRAMMLVPPTAAAAAVSLSALLCPRRCPCCPSSASHGIIHSVTIPAFGE